MINIHLEGALEGKDPIKSATQGPFGVHEWQEVTLDNNYQYINMYEVLLDA